MKINVLDKKKKRPPLLKSVKCLYDEVEETGYKEEKI